MCAAALLLAGVEWSLSVVIYFNFIVALVTVAGFTIALSESLDLPPPNTGTGCPCSILNFKVLSLIL